MPAVRRKADADDNVSHLQLAPSRHRGRRVRGVLSRECEVLGAPVCRRSIEAIYSSGDAPLGPTSLVLEAQVPPPDHARRLRAACEEANAIAIAGASFQTLPQTREKRAIFVDNPPRACSGAANHSPSAKTQRSLAQVSVYSLNEFSNEELEPGCHWYFPSTYLKWSEE